MRLTRRGLLRAGGAGAAGLAIGGVAGSRARAAAPKIAEDADRPNALLIMASNVRYDYVGAFDDTDEMAQTPNLDSLAEESLRFQHGVAESMPTVPARRSLLTGVRSFPFRDWTRTSQMPGEPGWNPIRDHYQPIFTDVMRDHGVTTAYATDNPFLVGPHFANFRETVDEFNGQLSQASWRDYNRPHTREAPKSEVSDYLLPALEGTDEERRLRQYVDWNRRNRRSEDDYSTARVGRDAVTLLGDLRERQPFFLGVDFFDASEPFDPPERYLERFGGRGSGVIPIQPFETPYGLVEDLDLDEAAIERVRQLYAAEVTFVDAWIGRVLNELDAQGLAGNTMVYFLADHGISLGERGIVGRFSERAYEEVYRIPYMIRHPNGRLAGEERRWFASTHDVAPTLLAFMGIARPGRMHGEDLTCHFEEEEAKPPSRRYFTTGFGESIMIGTEDWMLASDGRGSNKRLYERDEDEDQEKNVLNEHPFIEQRLAEAVVVACGGTIPVFDDNSAVRPGPEGGEAFVDRDGDGEPDTDEDEDLQDQRDAQERGTGLGQGMSGSPSDPRFLFACACGAALAFKVRRHAIEEAERHYRETHPELLGEVDCEELVRECSPEEAEASAGAAPA
jgi:arylsulfatase A-like enzyme